jgi:hypothetical protein
VGIYCDEAAVRLLTGHRRWLSREDFLAECVNVEVVADGEPARAFVDWSAVVAALKAGRLVCSGGERQVLLLAVSLAEGVPVDLRDALVGLDQATMVLVAEVVLLAAGHRRGVVALDERMARW